MPSRSGEPAESLSSVTAAASNFPTSLSASAMRSALSGGRARARERRQRPAHAPLGGRQLDGLGEPHRPGHDRRKGQPDQDACTTMSALRNMPHGERSAAAWRCR